MHGLLTLNHLDRLYSRQSRPDLFTISMRYASAEDADRDVPSPLCGLSMLHISATQIEQLRVQAVCAMQAVGTHCAAADTLSLVAGALDSARPSGTPSTI